MASLFSLHRGSDMTAVISKRVRRAIAVATAFIFFSQNFAWAVCADGTTFPASGFVAGQPPTVNWSPNVFTGTAGSIFIPDASVFEHNDPAQPPTGGGHNWAFDQGSTLCKAADTGTAGAAPTAWALPTDTSADCVLVPIVTVTTGNPPVAVITGCCTVPYQGEVLTPTCDPTQYVGGNPFVGPALPTNTYFNHLGCSISHGVATTPQSATSFLFVTGAPNTSSSLWVVTLTNVANPVVGGFAGKIVNGFDMFTTIPLGQKLTNATVSPDGQFVMATSISKLQTVFACLNPLGDPTRTNSITGAQSFPITGPIDPNFSVAPANTVPCMQVANNALAVDQTTTFGPDGQPYFGGQPGVDTINGFPGGPAANAWPQCIFNGFGFRNPAPPTLIGKLAVVFGAHSANHCGNAQPNSGFLAASVAQPKANIRHGQYMYASTAANTVVQFKVTVDPVSGLSQYRFRTYVTGGNITGLGVADDLGSLMVFTDPLGLDLAGQELVFKAPLCEDM
jgi:hypothetical protein